MKQKDKKQHIKFKGRLRNISLPDLDVLDDQREASAYKTARISSKLKHSQKNDSELQVGRVMEVMSNYQCRVALADQTVMASISGRLKQFLYQSSGLLAVGDQVELDLAPAPDFRIENLIPRRNSLIRYGSGTFQRDIVIAANIDILVITTSWLMPRFKPGLVDRYLILAAKHNIAPLIVVNKIDLCRDFEELEESLAYYRQIGCKIILTSTISGEGIDELRDMLKDRDSVFSGHSGAGKSSLINCLEPGIELLTAEVSDFNEKGKHTTTQAVLLPWSFGGHLLDTPGIKTISLHQDDVKIIPKLFPGFDAYYPLCKFRDCSHIEEVGCAVLEALEKGEIDPERYESYRWILQSP
ncbi:MAG: ribosome small subunit-dependent GTPase A [Candidatus Cloacimonetes bacterium]|nr:ribosome small subunit-dependent GTPase A [Candidatus Cloacimonadota bacterium]MDY0336665.1 ribosome small subunit-dependent GTPase A [Candidatus Cloacimonadaceae bacterium]MCK9333776.1 ribosome small subunit-dependent GTPase A [Candidatus Cloacimonadota bacterium]MDD2543443.1 ribosome small subunit-dependent GTPase A [Candidatus Cloacimonadota bacterium]MDD3096484.1 ribosome small subunit-dependent GTPase A [Candidatus Cloacimonadota bacterium]